MGTDLLVLKAEKKRMARASRPAQLYPADYNRARELRDELAGLSGRPVTLADVIGRGLECLADAHKRKAWLSPAEAAPVLQLRHRDAVEFAMRGTAAWQRENPGARILAITFDAPHRKVFIHSADGKERNPVAEMEITPLLIPEN